MRTKDTSMARADSSGKPYNHGPMQVLTPKQIVSELDKYIIGQADAKRAVAVAIRNRWRRMQLKDDDLKNATSGKNIIIFWSVMQSSPMMGRCKNNP